jgi:hypothetical protein
MENESQTKVAEWWERNRMNPYWSGSIVGVPWGELWPEAKTELTTLFETAAAGAVDFDPRDSD